MASVNYDRIFSYFLGSVSDYTIPALEEEDAEAIMTEWLHKAFADPYKRRLFSSFTMDDDTQMITFEFRNKIDDEGDEEFVALIGSKGMVIEWLNPQVKKKTLLSQMFSGKEIKWYSQAQQLGELQSLYDNTYNELRKIIRDRAYISNDYLEGR